MCLRSGRNTGRTSDAEGKIRALTSDEKEESTLLNQNTKMIQSSASPENTQNRRSVPASATENIPPELLLLIFTHCREENGTAVMIPPSSRSSWALGQVCSQWRQILLSAREFWSDIQIRSHIPWRKQDILPLIVSRVMAQAHTLVSMEIPVLEKMVFARIVILYAHRFQSLRLKLGSDLLGFFQILPLNLTSLRSLEVTCANAPHNGSISDQTEVLWNAPHLTRFSIFYPNGIKDLGSKGLSGLWISWSRLTFLECRGAYFTADLHDVLSQCTALCECSVMVRAPLERETTHHTHRRIVLPRLRSFCFIPFSDGVDWVTFLEPFMVPYLENISCELGAQEASEALVTRSGCRLKKMETFLC